MKSRICLLLPLLAFFFLRAEEMTTREYALSRVPRHLGAETQNAGAVHDPENPFAAPVPPPVFAPELKEALSTSFPVEFPEGSWVRALPNSRSLRMHNTAKNHAWLRCALMSANILQTRIHIETELRAFAADEIETMERAEGKGLSNETYLRLRREGRGEIIAAVSTPVEPKVNAVIERTTLLQFPHATDSVNEDGGFDVEATEKKIGFQMNVTPVPNLSGHMYLVLYPEFTQLLPKAASAFPDLDAMTPLIRSWFLTNTVQTWSGETQVAAETTSREDQRRWVLFVKATITDLEGAPILPPEDRDGILVTRIFPRGLNGGLLQSLFVDRHLLGDQLPLPEDLFVYQEGGFKPVSGEVARLYMHTRRGMSFPEGAWIREFPDMDAILIRNTEEELAKVDRFFFYQSEFTGPVALRLRVVSFDAQMVEDLERKRRQPFVASDWVALWREGKGKTEWTQFLITPSGINSIHQHVEKHIVPTVETAGPNGKKDRIFGGLETFDTGYVFNVTPTVQMDEKSVMLNLLPSWTEREADEEGDPTRALVHRETTQTTLLVDIDQPQLLHHTLSRDGKRRLVWLIDCELRFPGRVR